MMTSLRGQSPVPRPAGIAALFAVALLLFGGVAPAAAQSSSAQQDSPTDFLCVKHDQYGNVVHSGEPGYNEAEFSSFVYILQRLIGIFMVVGPVGGIVFGLYATVASVVQPSTDGDGGGHAKTRRNALLLGFGVPIFALGFKLLAQHLLPYNIGCIVPELPV